MSAVFSLAVDDGELAVNPCSRGGRLYDGTNRIWSQDQIDAMLGIGAYAHLRLPLMIALWTGLHQGDILKLDWSEYDLRVNQRKGRRHGHKPKILEVPDAPHSRPNWTGSGSTSARYADPAKASRGPLMDSARHGRRPQNAAGVHRKVTFNDFRGTAVTRLFASGVSKENIGIFTGHKEAEVNEILERHYLHREQRAEGIAAIEKLQAKFDGESAEV